MSNKQNELRQFLNNENLDIKFRLIHAIRQAELRHLPDFQVAELLLEWHKASTDKAVREAQLKERIKYFTLKARWQRMYLGREEDAVKTKRYVRSLKKQLANLNQGE